jgi:hypothetical protein
MLFFSWLAAYNSSCSSRHKGAAATRKSHHVGLDRITARAHPVRIHKFISHHLPVIIYAAMNKA